MNIRKWLDRYSIDCDIVYPSVRTRKVYKSGVALFLSQFNKFSEPKEVPNAAIKEWLLTYNKHNTRKHLICALKSFYKLTVGMPDKIDKIPYPKKEQKLPQPLDISEIQDIMRHCKNLKHRAIISLLYGCGLRVGEVLNLKPEHIDSRRMIINIIGAKGQKDRQVMLDADLLELLRKYFKQYKPKEYLFNGQNNEPQYTDRSINAFLKTYAHRAGLNKNVYAHLLRHSFATHLLEDGTDISIIQKLLGHSSPKTTQIYTHVSTAHISRVRSPFKNL